MICTKTNWRGFGIAPYFDQAWKLPAEDALDIATPQRPGKPHIVCLGLSRIANFDDLDPLSNDPELQVTVLRPGQAIPADARLVIVPGSKSTSADLTYLRAQGWDIDLKAHRRRGGYRHGAAGLGARAAVALRRRRQGDPRARRGAAGRRVEPGLAAVRRAQPTRRGGLNGDGQRTAAARRRRALRPSVVVLARPRRRREETGRGGEPAHPARRRPGSARGAVHESTRRLRRRPDGVSAPAVSGNGCARHCARAQARLSKSKNGLTEVPKSRKIKVLKITPKHPRHVGEASKLVLKHIEPPQSHMQRSQTIPKTPAKT